MFGKLAVNLNNIYIQLAILFIHIFFSILGFYNFFFNYDLSAQLLIQKTVDRQVTIARSGSTSIENYIKSLQNQLDSFVFSFQKVNENDVIDKVETRRQFEAYIQKTTKPSSGIALYDDTGKLLVIQNTQKITTGENEDFSDYDFIQWSKDPVSKGKTFIANPYTARAGASKGKIIMVVATPVYFGNKYKGTLAIRFLVGQFKDAFITPLSTELDEDSFIVDTNGVLITGDDKLINQNLISYAKQTKWDGSDDFVDKLSLALKKTEARTEWKFQHPDQKNKNYLVAIRKIDIPNTDKDLFLVATTPKDDITKSLIPLRSYGSVWLFISILITFIGGLLFIFLRTVSKHSKL